MQKTAEKKTKIIRNPANQLYNPVKSLIYFHPVFMQIYTQALIWDNTIYVALNLGLIQKNFPVLIM